MDHPWTTDIESQLLNREKMAEGKGFEPLDRVNGRRDQLGRGRRRLEPSI
jgi:hypothetical protein